MRFPIISYLLEKLNDIDILTCDGMRKRIINRNLICNDIVTICYFMLFAINKNSLD